MSKISAINVNEAFAFSFTPGRLQLRVRRRGLSTSVRRMRGAVIARTSPLSLWTVLL